MYLQILFSLTNQLHIHVSGIALSNKTTEEKDLTQLIQH